MNCREFEQALDFVFAGDRAGESEAGRDLEVHAAECSECRELLELARLPQPETIEAAGWALGGSSQGACRQAEAGLNEFVLGQAPVGTDRDLLAEHLRHCPACAALAGELELLSADLPRLAILEPEVSLVASVLRRTLPVPVRLRRWWASTWPTWVRRPQFAVEISYAATMLLIVLVGLPGSPLQAMPERAVELVRAEPMSRLGALPNRAEEEIAARLRATVGEGKQTATAWTEEAMAGLGTLRREVASWFVTTQDEPTTQDPSQ